MEKRLWYKAIEGRILPLPSKPRYTKQPKSNSSDDTNGIRYEAVLKIKKDRGSSHPVPDYVGSYVRYTSKTQHFNTIMKNYTRAAQGSRKYQITMTPDRPALSRRQGKVKVTRKDANQYKGLSVNDEEDEGEISQGATANMDMTEDSWDKNNGGI